MIGGPTDVVVEPNIVRAAAGDSRCRCRAAAGTMVEPRRRAPFRPAPETAIAASWPLQPEPAAGRRAPRPASSRSPKNCARPFQPRRTAAARRSAIRLPRWPTSCRRDPPLAHRPRPQADQAAPPNNVPKSAAEPRPRTASGIASGATRRTTPRACPEPRVAAAQPVPSDVAAAADQQPRRMAQQPGRLAQADRKPNAVNRARRRRPRRCSHTRPRRRQRRPCRPDTKQLGTAQCAHARGRNRRRARTPSKRPPARRYTTISNRRWRAC